jgi:endoglucanase
MTDENILHVEGSRLFRNGHEIVLHGVGIGGFLNMENYISGYAGTESLMRKGSSKPGA